MNEHVGSCNLLAGQVYRDLRIYFGMLPMSFSSNKHGTLHTITEIHQIRQTDSGVQLSVESMRAPSKLDPEIGMWETRMGIETESTRYRDA